MMKYYCYRTFLLVVLGILTSGKCLSGPSAKQNNKPMVVVIDPGHGGKDPGAVNKSIREKDIVLGVGLKLGNYIKENYPDVKVIFTRSTDVFVPLIERSRIANRNKADLFISIHANHCGTPATRGTETFVLGLHRSTENLEVAKKENSVILLEENYSNTYEGFDPNSSESYIMFELVQDIYMDQSLSFANDIQHQFKARIATSNRGVKQAGFLVLRQSSMPSVLVEAGFLSNQNEANYLKSEEGQQNIALSIFDAFRKFKAKKSGTNSPVLAEVKTSVSGKAVSNDVSKPEEAPVTDTTVLKPETNSAKNSVSVVDITSVKQQDSLAENTLKIETADEQAATPPVNVSAKTSEARAEKTPISNFVAGSNTYYSIQIGASTTLVEPVAANFKGLKDVRREKTDKYYRYYVGNETSKEKIASVLQQVRLKFPQAFVVSFVDGNRIILNAASQ